jgi:hypothetical protein
VRRTCPSTWPVCPGAAPPISPPCTRPTSLLLSPPPSPRRPRRTPPRSTAPPTTNWACSGLRSSRPRQPSHSRNAATRSSKERRRSFVTSPPVPYKPQHRAPPRPPPVPALLSRPRRFPALHGIQGSGCRGRLRSAAPCLAIWQPGRHADGECRWAPVCPVHADRHLRSGRVRRPGPAPASALGFLPADRIDRVRRPPRPGPVSSRARRPEQVGSRTIVPGRDAAGSPGPNAPALLLPSTHSVGGGRIRYFGRCPPPGR